MRPGGVTQSVTPMYHLVTRLQYLRDITTSAQCHKSELGEATSIIIWPGLMNEGIFENFSPCRSPAGCIARQGQLHNVCVGRLTIAILNMNYSRQEY